MRLKAVCTSVCMCVCVLGRCDGAIVLLVLQGLVLTYKTRRGWLYWHLSHVALIITAIHRDFVILLALTY